MKQIVVVGLALAASAVFAQGAPKAECPMRRQLRHQSFGDGRRAFVLLGLRRGFAAATVRIVDIVTGRRSFACCVALGGIRFRLDRHFILGPDITTIDAQAAVACDADEDARTGDFLGIEGERPFLEGLKRGLQLAEPLVDLVRKLIGAFTLLDQTIKAGLDRVRDRSPQGEDRQGRILAQQRLKVGPNGPVDRIGGQIMHAGDRLDCHPRIGRFSGPPIYLGERAVRLG